MTDMDSQASILADHTFIYTHTHTHTQPKQLGGTGDSSKCNNVFAQFDTRTSLWCLNMLEYRCIIYVFVRKHTCTRIQRQTHTHTHTHTQTHARTHTRTHMHACICTIRPLHVDSFIKQDDLAQICTDRDIDTDTHILLHSFTYAHTYTHSHMHTHTLIHMYYQSHVLSINPVPPLQHPSSPPHSPPHNER